MAKDIQDYWRQSWTGNEAIPQDGSAKLYSGDKEIDVMWSGTDVVYAKQKDNLAYMTGVSRNGYANTNNGVLKAVAADTSTVIGMKLISAVEANTKITLSFDVSDISIKSGSKFGFLGFWSPEVYFDKVGHYSVSYTKSSASTEGTTFSFEVNKRTVDVGDYCIIKNIKLEKNIVDTQYSVAPSVTDNRVKIGKHYYHTTQIGNLIWTTENLNEDLGGGTWEGYYDNDPTYGVKGYGKLYTWDAICKANETPSDALAAILPAGWRVPTKADFDALAGTSGLTSAKIKEKWYQSTPGTNDTGFSSVAGGYRGNSGTFTSGSGVYQSSTVLSEQVYRFADTDISRTLSSTTTARSVRLVRDATSSADVIFLDGDST